MEVVEIEVVVTRWRRCITGTGVTAYSLHPGAVQTDLQRHMFPYPIVGPILRKLLSSWFLTAEAGAQTTIYCATEPSLHGISGKYYT
jgi:retinol dehydrogenase-12